MKKSSGKPEINWPKMAEALEMDIRVLKREVARIEVEVKAARSLTAHWRVAAVAAAVAAVLFGLLWEAAEALAAWWVG
jgi:hypothetical protein